MPDVSVVTGTLNRLATLREMVFSVRRDAWGLDYEIVIVDGGSTDGTLEWLKKERSSDIVLIEQGQPLGAVKAFNEGFRHARGRYVMNMNDDAIIHPPVIPVAIEKLKEQEKLSPIHRVGQIAIPYSAPLLPAPSCYSVSFNGQMYLYANFGMIERTLGDQLGWWSEKYEQYGGDTELSMAVWDAGYTVAKLVGSGYIEHFELNDAVRRGSSIDAETFFAYWRKKLESPDRNAA